MKKAQALGSAMGEAVKEGHLRPPDSLAQYSKWLASFQGSQYEQHIEIPGIFPCRALNCKCCDKIWQPS